MLTYVTTNPGKVREAESYLPAESIDRLDYDYTEIQSDDLGPIAAHGAREAYRHAGDPVLVDDAGLFIDDLDGFPGPYSSYVEDTLGVDGVWNAAANLSDPSAAFRCVLAYCDGKEFAATPDPIDREDRVAAAAASGPNSDADAEADADTEAEANADTDADTDRSTLPVKLFEGYVPGTIVEPRGDGGFGYDPIFEHNGTTFAEMDTERKNSVSHRGRALAKFAEWFAQR